MNRGYTLTATLRTAIASSLLFTAMTAWSADSPADGNVQPPYSWRGIDGTGVFPARGIVTEFHDLAADVATVVKDPKKGDRKLDLPGAPGSRKNIIWRTTLPHWGQNTPVAVRDRVFVLCEEGWKSDAPLLVCLDVKDGKILWQQPVDHLDAWPADKAKVAKETRAKHLRYWREAMTWWNCLFWDNATNRFASRPAAEFNALAVQAKQAGYDWGQGERKEVDGKQAVQARRGVSGGARGRYYWKIGTDEMKQTYEACARNRYHWYPGWTSEGPYFGSCMGSVVSDGGRIYAVTALDGAACFDLDGNRLWVTDLEGKQLVGYPASADRIHNHMASPVLAGGKLVYYHRDAVEFIALDAQTGRVAWRTPGPIKAGDKPRFHQVAGTPIGYDGGHMVPGGTPVVMVLGTTPVVVSGHGMVCRIADGKFLGQVGFPAEFAKKSKPDDADMALNAPDHRLAYASSYTSWVAQGDTLYAVALGRLVAVRMGLKGDALTQEVVWNLDRVDGRNPNPVILNSALYVYQGKKGASVKALDAATGKILASGPGAAYYATNLAFTRDLAIWKENDQSGKTQDVAFQGTPATVLGRGLVTYTVVGVPDLKPKGSGHLWPESPTGEIAERHIAALGTPRLAMSNAGLACWGNRIIIRDNDYIWCIGDPAKPFAPAAEVLEAGKDGGRKRPKHTAGTPEGSARERIRAAEALLSGPAPSADAIPGLIDMTHDEFHRVRQAATRTLARIGPAALPALRQALRHPSFYTRWCALRAMRIMGPSARPAVADLHRSLRDPAIDVRLEAVRALARIGGGDDIAQALSTALSDPYDLTRREAAGALGRSTSDATTAAEALVSALNDDAPQVRQLAASAVAKVGKEAVPAITKVLERGDLASRRAAARALGAIGPDASSALPALRKLLRDELAAAQEHLSGMESGAIRDSRLRHAMGDQASLSALAQMGSAAVPVLVELLKTGDDVAVRWACRGLSRIGPEAAPAVPALRRAVDHPDRYARDDIARAIQAIEE